MTKWNELSLLSQALQEAKGLDFFFRMVRSWLEGETSGQHRVGRTMLRVEMNTLR